MSVHSFLSLSHKIKHRLFLCRVQRSNTHIHVTFCSPPFTTLILREHPTQFRALTAAVQFVRVANTHSSCSAKVSPFFFQPSAILNENSNRWPNLERTNCVPASLSLSLSPTHTCANSEGKYRKVVVVIILKDLQIYF